MRRTTLAIVLLIAIAAIGAGPASRPLTPSQQTEVMRKEIDRLKAENEELRLKLADLEGKIAAGKLIPAEPVQQGVTFKPGGLARQTRKVGSHVNDAKDLKDGLAIAAKFDKQIEAYAASHKLPDKAIEGLNEGRPAPGQPKELLDLLGKFKMKDQTPHSESGELFLHGLNDSYWDVTVTDGVVYSVSGPHNVEYGYAIQGG